MYNEIDKSLSAHLKVGSTLSYHRIELYAADFSDRVDTAVPHRANTYARRGAMAMLLRSVALPPLRMINFIHPPAEAAELAQQLESASGLSIRLVPAPPFESGPSSARKGSNCGLAACPSLHGQPCMPTPCSGSARLEPPVDRREAEVRRLFRAGEIDIGCL